MSECVIEYQHKGVLFRVRARVDEQWQAADDRSWHLIVTQGDVVDMIQVPIALGYGAPR